MDNKYKTNINKIQEQIDEVVSKNKKNRINSYRKGTNFERKICKYLSDILKIDLIRTPMSGGFSTIHTTDYARGDIIPTSKNVFFPFVFETKHYKNVNILDVLYNQNSIIFKWIEEVNRNLIRDGNRDDGKTIGIIIFRTNYSKNFAILQYNVLKEYNYNCLKNKKDIIIFNYKNILYFITLLDNIDFILLYNSIKEKYNVKK